MMNTLHALAVAGVWFAIAGLLYVYVGYPLLLLILGAFTHREKAPAGYFPTLSILIAAYNEEAGIKQKIVQTLALSYPEDKIELLVISDGSTDRTDEIVLACEDKRVRLIRPAQRKGKTNAQNIGVEHAGGEVLVFSDATTIYHPMALQFLAANYVDPHVGAVSGRYQYFDQNGNSPTGLGTVAFWNYENLIKQMQSRLRTITGCCGCIYSVRRSAYTSLDSDLISDLVQPLCAILKGFRVVFEDRALAYEETTKSSAEEFSMRVRVITRGIRGIISVAELLNPFKHAWISFQLMSHKVLRWFVPLFLVVLLLANTLLVDTPGYRQLWAAQLIFYGFVVLTTFVPLHRIWKPLGIPLYFCTVNLAALVSVLEVLRGRKYVIWETVRS